jgi:hypothetical protein
MATANTWEQCRDRYASSETTWRKSLAERLADWAAGCGWCGEQPADHAEVQPLTPVTTADAVLATPSTPLAPIDPVLADYVTGRIGPLSHLTPELRQRLVAVCVLASDALPDVIPGGVR